MQIQTLFEKFDALNERERFSILFLLVIAIVVFFAEFFILPLTQKYESINKNIVSVENKTKQLQSQLLLLKNKKKNEAGPREKQLQKISLLNEQITNLNLRLKENMRGLIEPKEMAKILESVLNKSIGLKLQSIESQASIPLTPFDNEKGEKKENFGIYQHGMKMTLTGSYLATLKYLEALDDLPWKFYWDVLDINVDKYPISTINISVHTLSFHKDWIGV
jgi:MSHA biogenesis protein MshJ